MANSMAVRQFYNLASGREKPHTPRNPIQVNEVLERELYCLKCMDVTRFDVVSGMDQGGNRWQIATCRSCGAQYEDRE